MASGRVAVGTIVSKNFLCFARVLAGSVRAHYPDLPFFTALTDEPEGLFDPATEPFEVVPFHALGVPGLRAMCFQYIRHQLSIAVKPYLLRYLLDRGFGTAVFLDADILVTGSLDPLLDAVAEHAIVLTPHLVGPLAGPDRIERELNILQSGIYNGGCLGISARPSTRPFLSWWADRLRTHCRYAIAGAMHFDQRWLDLVPGLFENVHVLREGGCNVAHWNLPERSAFVSSMSGDGDGSPCCRFFHFSGFDPARIGTMTKYSPRVAMNSIDGAARLFDRYTALLRQEGFNSTIHWPYAYGCFDNGVAIPDVGRRIYLDMDMDAERERFGDPFAVEGTTSYFHWLTEPLKGSQDPHRTVTRIWESIYRSRPDLQIAFPDIFGADYDAFLNWIRTSGLQEHRVSDALLPGVQSGLSS